MNGNPYGAVPAALSETRLTLKDIMADLLATKVAEGRLRLEQSKAETETAMVAAGLEKERLAENREMERMRMTRAMHDEDAARASGQFEKTFSLQQTAEERAGRGQEMQHEIAQGQLDVSKGQLKVAESAELRAAAETRRKNEIRSIGEWASSGGIHPGLLDYLGVDKDKKITRADAENLYANLQVTFKANPSMGLMAHGYALKAELTAIQEKIQAPGTPPQEAAGLKKMYDRKLAQFEALDKLIIAEKSPSQEKIVESARRSWAENPELAKQYETYDKFLTAFQKEVEEARGVFHDDLQLLKNPKTTTPAEQQAAVDGIREAVKEIQAGKYSLSPQELKIVQKMTSQVDPQQAAQKLHSLKNILNASPKAQPAAAGGAPGPIPGARFHPTTAQ